MLGQPLAEGVDVGACVSHCRKVQWSVWGRRETLGGVGVGGFLSSTGMGPKAAVDGVSVVIVKEAELVRAALASAQLWMLVLGAPQLSKGSMSWLARKEPTSVGTELLG